MEDVLSSPSVRIDCKIYPEDKINDYEHFLEICHPSDHHISDQLVDSLYKVFSQSQQPRLFQSTSRDFFETFYAEIPPKSKFWVGLEFPISPELDKGD